MPIRERFEEQRGEKGGPSGRLHAHDTRGHRHDVGLLSYRSDSLSSGEYSKMFCQVMNIRKNIKQ